MLAKRGIYIPSLNFAAKALLHYKTKNNCTWYRFTSWVIFLTRLNVDLINYDGFILISVQRQRTRTQSVFGQRTTAKYSIQPIKIRRDFTFVFLPAVWSVTWWCIGEIKILHQGYFDHFRTFWNNYGTYSNFVNSDTT